jgi:hypothetical protein
MKGPRVRVKKEFAWIESKPYLGLIRPGCPKAVGLARTDAGNKTMPDPAVIFGEWKPRLAALGIEEADLHPIGTLCAHREVGPTVGRCRPQGKPVAR